MSEIRRSSPNRKQEKYKGLLPDAKFKSCLIRILKLGDSKLFKETHLHLWNYLENDELPARVFGEIYFKQSGKVDGHDYIIEIYKDQIRTFVEDHFSEQLQRLPKKARAIAHMEKFAFVMLEEFVHLIALNGPVLLNFKGVVELD